jgi:hypothetical protein
VTLLEHHDESLLLWSLAHVSQDIFVLVDDLFESGEGFASSGSEDDLLESLDLASSDCSTNVANVDVLSHQGLLHLSFTVYGRLNHRLARGSLCVSTHL